MFRQLSIQLSSKGYILIIIFVDIKDTILCNNSSLKFEIMAKQLYVASQRVL